jgi:hypothetical protein
MASAMSVTWNSSKQGSQVSPASAAAASRSGSSSRTSPRLSFFAETPDALVHVGHEFMKMRSALANDWARLEEKVHQHGLAAADLAENVDACAKQPAERGRFACKPMFAQPPIKRAKLPKDCLLGDIPFDLAGRDAGRVKAFDISMHYEFDMAFVPRRSS